MAVSMNTLTLVMLPLAFAILHMHAYMHTSSQHIGKESQRLHKEAAAAVIAGSATPDQLKRVANAYVFTTADSKYLADVCFSCIGDMQWLFLHSVCVFLHTLSSCYFFSPSLHSTHTGSKGGK